MSYDFCSIDNYGGAGCSLCVVEMEPQPDTDGLHNHDCDELVLVKSGIGKHITENGEYQITRGDMFLIRRGAMHGYRDMEGVSMVNFLYRQDGLALPLREIRDTPGYQAFFAAGPQLTDDFRFRTGLSLDSYQLQAAEGIAAAMAEEQRARRDGFRFAMTTQFMQLILLVSRAASPEERRTRDGRRLECISKILRFMEESYGGQVRSEDIAVSVNMSVRTLERFCFNAIGQTPMEYLADMRLNKAAEALRATRDSVMDVAMRSGFSDSGYFCRAFKKKFTCSPREYRRRFTAAALL